MKFNIELLNDTTIRVGQTTLSPWPTFKVKGEHENLPWLLAELLLSHDPVAILWSAKINENLKQRLLSFNEALLPELLPISQMWPDRFMDWANWCPALITLLAGIHADDDKQWDNVERLQLMQAGWRAVLEAADWPATKSSLKLLRKVHISNCTPELLADLCQQRKHKRKLKLLRHVKRITPLTVDTLNLPAHMLSVPLLEITENQLMPYEADSVRELCEQLLRYRQDLGIEPIWPYSNSHLSANALYCAVQLQRMHACACNDGKPFELPPPPLHSFRSSRFDIEPLTSLSALYQEGRRMQNCVVSYGVHVIEGNHYVYRLNAPERATVLLVRHGEHWYAGQVKTLRNGSPRPATLEAIEKWLGTKIGKEGAHVFPF